MLCLLLPVAALSCAGPPRAPLPPPATPLPIPMRLLGDACERDLESRTLYARCAPSGRYSVVLLTEVSRILRLRPACTQGFCDDPLAPEEAASEPIAYPPRTLGKIATARYRPGDDDGFTVYADGRNLWVLSVKRVPLQFPEAGVLVLDRALMTEADRVWIGTALGLPADLDLTDDAAVAEAIRTSHAAGRD